MPFAKFGIVLSPLPISEESHIKFQEFKDSQNIQLDEDSIKKFYKKIFLIIVILLYESIKNITFSIIYSQ